ncbi:MAG: hypothetical protein CMN28_08855 [Salinisphaeraceae bacterium]|jgi:tetratricopeptide (TPR) repeat protein|nr:hypothetical protein [Salinisphaeraceae bacterium]
MKLSRKSLSHLTVFWLAACSVPLLVHAQPDSNVAGLAPAATVDAPERKRAEQLKYKALQEIRNLRATELEQAFPADTRVSVYVDIGVNAFILDEVKVRIDGSEPLGKTYEDFETPALIKGGVHRVLRANVEPGDHQLFIEFIGHEEDDPADAEPRRGAIALNFTKTEAPKALILPVVPQALTLSKGTKTQNWQWRDEIEDPRLGMVRFLRDTDRQYEAMMELLDIAGPPGNPEEPPEGYYPLLALSYLDFGMREYAYDMQRKAYDEGSDQQTLNVGWLAMAELDFERGDIAQALELLEYVEPFLTPRQFVTWQDLKSRIYLSQGRYAEAAEALASGHNALEVLTEVDLTNNQDMHMRYNYAVALIKSGKPGEGRTLLDRLGRITDFDESERVVRDKANLALAYEFLRSEQGATAKTVFQRIRLQGPHVNQALLGYGWSELAPRGERVDRVAVGDEPEAGEYGITEPNQGRFDQEKMSDRLRVDPFRRINLGPFPMADQADTKEEAARQALVPWADLAEKDATDPTVQEALISIPYALDQMGRYADALGAYQRAIAKLESARGRLQNTAAMLEDNVIIEDLRQGNFDAVPGVPWMLATLSSNQFNEPYRNYSDMKRLRASLKISALGAVDTSMSLRLTPSNRQSDLSVRLEELREELEAESRVHALLAQKVVVQEIDKQRKLLDEFLVSARLGAATFYSRVPAEAREAGN